MYNVTDVQALVYGDNKQFNSVLIVPEILEIRAWCAHQNITVTDDASMMALDSVKTLISGEIAHNSVLMKSFERPEKWELIMEPFSQVLLIVPILVLHLGTHYTVGISWYFMFHAMVTIIFICIGEPVHDPQDVIPP